MLERGKIKPNLSVNLAYVLLYSLLLKTGKDLPSTVPQVQHEVTQKPHV